MDSEILQNKKVFNKFAIPPNFALARFHAQCCKLYKNDTHEIDDLVQNLSMPSCPCCKRKKGHERISLCQNEDNYLNNIAEEVPLFFGLKYILSFLLIVIIFVKAAEFLFQCTDQNVCKITKYSLGGFEVQMSILLGYTNGDDKDFMIQMVIFSLIILVIKYWLKRKKYQSRINYGGIERRSVMLINLSKRTTTNDIIKLFEGFLVDEITFTYKVTEYHESMTKMHKIEKKLTKYSKKLKIKERKNKDKDKTDSQKILKFHRDFVSQINQLDDLKGSMTTIENRTSVAFVVLNSKNEKDKVLKKFQCGWLLKLFYKTFPSFSKSSLHGKHISMVDAPAPDDVIWQNLGNPYISTKLKRFSSFFISATILTFGMVSQIFIINNSSNQILKNKLIATGVIFLINFCIINFLEWTTHNVERRGSGTAIKLSLIRKITFFMFINISITPYLLFIYKLTSQGHQEEQTLESVGFQILLISLSNCFKPLLTIFSVERISKWINSSWQASRKQRSKLNQIEANLLFEPLDFPIQIYYSLVHTSFMTMFFYLSYYQILVVIELPALFLLFFVAKWMLVRVCKKPVGISLRLNNLAQSLIRVYLVFYWCGFYITKYLLYLENDQNERKNFIEFAITKNYSTIISIVLCLALFFFSEPLISFIVRRLQQKEGGLMQGFMGQIMENRTYKQANAGFTVNGQNYAEMKERLKKLDQQILSHMKK